MSTVEIENMLRRAPQPKPPGNLQQQLKAQALSVPRLSSPAPARHGETASWLSRWWAAIAPTVVSLACGATLAVRHQTARNLKAELEKSATAASAAVQRSARVGPVNLQNASAPGESELARLRALAASLKEEIAKLEQIQAQNELLRGQLASRSAGVFTTEEMSAMEQARERALNIQCVNNLKQLGLAVRVWSIDHHEMSPPNVQCLSNELGSSFKVLVCPADTGRQAATDASSFTPANSSYEYLAPNAPDTEPQRIAFRCPIHGNLGLIDGSVQMGLGKTRPDWIVQHNGKLYLEEPQARASNSVTLPPDATKQNQ